MTTPSDLQNGDDFTVYTEAEQTSPLRGLLRKIQLFNNETCDLPEGRYYQGIRELIEAEQQKNKRFMSELTVLLSAVADGCLPVEV